MKNNLFPKVTVLMPVYNGAEFIKDQVDSILAQRGVNVELYIVDDCSSDESFSLLEREYAAEKKVNLARNLSNLGLIATISKLAEIEIDGYFAFSDQDDVWDDDKLIRSIEHMQRTGSILVYSNVRVINQYGAIVEDNYFRSKNITPYKTKSLIPYIYRNPVIGHTIVGHSKILEDARPIPGSLRYYEPWILCSAGKLGKISSILEPLGSYRQHNNNVVGAKKSVFKLLADLRMISHIKRRQDTRVKIIANIAQKNTEVNNLSKLYSLTVIGKILATPMFFFKLMRHVKEIGMTPIFVETLLFPFSSGRQFKNNAYDSAVEK